jgi:hypothetical protein
LKWDGAVSGQGRCAPGVCGIRHTTTPCGQRHVLAHPATTRGHTPPVRARWCACGSTTTRSAGHTHYTSITPERCRRAPSGRGCSPHWTGRAQRSAARSKSRVVRLPHAVLYPSSSALASRIHRRSLAPVDAQRAPLCTACRGCCRCSRRPTPSAGAVPRPGAQPLCTAAPPGPPSCRGRDGRIQCEWPGGVRAHRCGAPSRDVRVRNRMPRGSPADSARLGGACAADAPGVADAARLRLRSAPCRKRRAGRVLFVCGDSLPAAPRPRLRCGAGPCNGYWRYWRHWPA